MASETADEKNSEGEAPVEAEEVEKQEAGEPVKEDESVGVDEVEEKEDEGSKKRKGGRRGRLKKDLEEPVTPRERPTRERKVVERYSEPSAARSSGSKGVSIAKGSGTQLKDIPNVAFKFSKRKADENLQTLHTILFGKRAKVQTLKKNIGQFSGFVWDENEPDKHKAKVREKIDKCVKAKLTDFCDVLNISINKSHIKKEELSAKIFDFLESPHSTTDILLADKEQKVKTRKRKATPSKNVSSGEASTDPPTKKQKRASQTQTGDKQKHSEEEEDDDKVKTPEGKGDSHDDSDADMVPKEESDDNESDPQEMVNEPKKQISSQKGSSKKTVKKSSVAKSSSLKIGASDADGNTSSKLKKKQVEKDQSNSQEEKVSGKKRLSNSAEKILKEEKGKEIISYTDMVEPSREDMLAVVVDILKEADFDKATLTDVLRQLSTHFGVDLSNRKAEVKDVITEVIKNMSDDEDEEDGDGEEDDEAKDNDEAEEDEDKDGNDDA